MMRYGIPKYRLPREVTGIQAEPDAGYDTAVLAPPNASLAPSRCGPRES